MTRSTPFSYACGRCSRCCYHKGIALNPYEVLRLARNRGLTTSELIARFTERAGTQLRRREDGSCVFLGAAGCEVHPDRPLVCRIYPLARHVSAEDAETFTEGEPHPRTEGVYGTSGAVGDYLEAQGAAPFTDAADRYLKVFRALAESLVAHAARLREADRALLERSAARPRDDAVAENAWLDIDRTVDDYCHAQGLAKPAEPERLLALHIEALSAWPSHLNQEAPQ